MKKQFAILLFALVVLPLPLLSQHVNIVVGATNAPEEPTIIINPKNTQELVAGANLDNYYISQDGGITWTHGILTSSHGVWGDPVVICDTAGAFYFFHLSNPASGNWIDRIVCQKLDSLNGSWNDGTYAGLNGTKAQDKQWAVVDRKTNTIYMTWTQFDEYGSGLSTDSTTILFSKSTDGGQTWDSAIRINKVAGDCIDSDNTVEGAVPAVGPNGEVYVSWAGPEGLVFDRSSDGGATWLDEDIFAAPMGGGWDYMVPGIQRANGLPVTVCDTSQGPYRGTIYINWSDQTNGSSNTDVWLVKSTDGGDTWTTPLRVNNDTTATQQFFTWVTIDQVTGYLWFIWYDRRNYTDNRTDVFMACSKDGGQTFENFKVSDSPFTPTSSVFFGDYTNITAHNNVVRPIWTRLESGQLSILTAIVDTALSIEETFSVPDSDIEIFPNPSEGSFCLAFKMHSVTPFSVELLDITGNVITKLLEGFTTTGRQIHYFDASDYGLQSGVYFIILRSNEKTFLKKWVLVE
ncbi:MAG: glycosyl hydrolase [Bacteroidetes bacterium GWF2_43_63]|nr:MAG: glycosyl hydrolase [Bacteroidetes bacterium GWE2_42_42]OFY56429.1 MAG: glycosyl hydrolase [Bacteroidetes bacterium GWF2_43_63]HBG72007.1 glycosyl hydrolase [Bacteroidales bacterium]HCB63039.1 glycosyl hydrolase [Bacteroidales bacterium]HCY23257.1 glycosyl hydrolase [Bacteroidales bacterium]